MDCEGKGGQRRVRRKGELEREERKKEVSRGEEPGVRGFEEDRLKMDGSEECGESLQW